MRVTVIGTGQGGLAAFGWARGLARFGAFSRQAFLYDPGYGAKVVCCFIGVAGIITTFGVRQLSPAGHNNHPDDSIEFGKVRS